MKSITPDNFINTLFSPELLLPDERPVVAWPDSFVSPRTGKRVEYMRQTHRFGSLPRGVSTYFCVSTVTAQRRRQVKKRLADVRTAMVLVLDDIGTKAREPAVEPSYSLQTSAGNFQWGYLLEPFDVSTAEGAKYYDSVLLSMARAGFNDEGFRSASRLARLPGAAHSSGFVAELAYLRANRSWDLEDLFAAFDVPLVEGKAGGRGEPGRFTSLPEAAREDAVLAYLLDGGWPVYGHNTEWVFVECPWRASHTDGAQGSSSTAYSPRDYGRMGVGFKCLHGHCAGRDVVDFMNFIMRKRNKE